MVTGVFLKSRIPANGTSNISVNSWKTIPNEVKLSLRQTQRAL